jgi:hypothetical protein
MHPRAARVPAERGHRLRDTDVRRALLHRLEVQYSDDDATRIVEEMGVWSGSVRIDVAVINGELSGFELKSDRDTLDRLPLQAELYSKVFDRVTLVCGERHAVKATQLVPAWWGITVANDGINGVSLEDSRPSEGNPAADPYLIAQLLWRTEVVSILGRTGIGRGLSGMRVKELHTLLASTLDRKNLAEVVRTALKARADWLR